MVERGLFGIAFLRLGPAAGLEPLGATLACRAADFDPPPGSSAPQWFSDTAMPPEPVNWYLNTSDPDQNTCYFAPRGEGAVWEDIGLGCHSPRLDIDNIDCNPNITDPSDDTFCAPENINVDYPPTDEWFRIGVHFYSGSMPEDITPTVKIFCDGQLASVLGPEGYTNPVRLNESADYDDMWMVADVLFRDDGCVKECIVQPIHAVGTTNPVIQTFGTYSGSFTPAYPAIP